MKIIACDPGLARVGWAVVEGDGNSFKLCDCGLIETPMSLPIAGRLIHIHEGLKTVLEKHKVSQMALEELFFQKNVKTAIDVAQARGVMLLTAHIFGLPVFEYTPNQVKQAVTSNSRADKYQVGQMVKMLFGLPSPPKPDDVADACALGLCHLFCVR